MDIEKVKGPDSSNKSNKKERSTPDTEEFQELVKPDKVSEIEFEKPKKRKFYEGKEDSQSLKNAAATQKEKFKASKEEKTPQISTSHQSTKASKEEKTFQKEKTQSEKTTVKKDETTIQSSDEVVVVDETKKTFENIKGEKTDTKEKISSEKNQNIRYQQKQQEQKTEQKKEQVQKEYKKEQVKTEEHKKSIEKTYLLSSVLQEMTSHIAQVTQNLTQPITPYLSHFIVPIFEKMVGTIIQIQAQGITKTEVILNSKAFASSLFFGSTIRIERYSTAPDSFNIFLQGPKQAVEAFQANIDSLYEAFKRGDFEFTIGRLEAEFERPLFKRKEKPRFNDSDKSK